MTQLAQQIDLAGGRVATYEVIGDGEPLFFFQGGPGFSANLLRPEAELLADRFAVHLVDPHGSGGSTPPADPSQYDHLGTARFYDEVRRALGIERATIMGISFGAVVALTYAALFPEATTNCVAIAALAVSPEGDDGADAAEEMDRFLSRHAGQPWYPGARRTWDEWTDRVLAAEDPSEVDAMMAEVLPLYFAHPERASVQRTIAAWRDARGDLAAAKAWEGGLWQTIDVRPLLPEVRSPLLVLVGALDPICGPAQGELIAAAVPHAELVVVPDCGHFVPDEAPEEFRATVVAFRDRHP